MRTKSLYRHLRRELSTELPACGWCQWLDEYCDIIDTMPHDVHIANTRFISAWYDATGHGLLTGVYPVDIAYLAAHKYQALLDAWADLRALLLTHVNRR